MNLTYNESVLINTSLYYVSEQESRTKNNLAPTQEAGWYCKIDDTTTYGPYSDSSQALSMLSTLHHSQFQGMRKAG